MQYNKQIYFITELHKSIRRKSIIKVVERVLRGLKAFYTRIRENSARGHDRVCRMVELNLDESILFSEYY